MNTAYEICAMISSSGRRSFSEASMFACTEIRSELGCRDHEMAHIIHSSSHAFLGCR